MIHYIICRFVFQVFFDILQIGYPRIFLPLSFSPSFFPQGVAFFPFLSYLTLKKYFRFPLFRSLLSPFSFVALR
jgi:hypothetical protein